MKSIIYRFLLLCLLTLGLSLQGMASIASAPAPLAATSQAAVVAAPCHAMPMMQTQATPDNRHCAAPHAKADADCAQHAPCCLPVVLPVAPLSLPAVPPVNIYTGYLPQTLPLIAPDTPEHPPKRFTPFLA